VLQKEIATMAEMTLEKSVTIDKPADEVFAYVADEKNQMKFRRNVHSVEHLGGGRVKTVRKHFGRRIETEGTVRSDPQKRSLTFEGQAKTNHGPESSTVVQTVTPNGDSSSTMTVRATIEIGDPPGPVKAHIEKVAAHELQSNLEHLKHLLEAPEGFHEELDKHLSSF
jgi:uncharacterized membrane protein